MPARVGERVYAVNGPVVQVPTDFLGGNLGVASVWANLLLASKTDTNLVHQGRK